MGNLIKIVDRLDSKETTLVHGTSLETAIEILEKGRMTPNRMTTDPNAIESYKGYLFFSPHASHFRGHELDGLFDRHTYGEAIRLASRYAKSLSRLHYINYQLGYFCSTIQDYFSLTRDYKKFSKELDAELLNEEPFKSLPEKVVFNMLQESQKRRGVLLGFGKEVFRLRIERGKDMPRDEICIYLPRGISSRYVNAIVPLGDVERKALKKYATQRAA